MGESGRRFRPGSLVAEALDVVQAPRAVVQPEIMLRGVRRCVDELADHVTTFTDPAIHALTLLESLLGRLEGRLPADRRGLEIARLELTQRILQLGQLLFVSPH